LFHEGAAAAEIRLMLKQLHFEIRLLEPWLATGSPGGEARFQLVPDKPAAPVATAARKPIVTPAGHSLPSQLPSKSVETNQVSGTLFESEFGMLLLGTWFEDRSQFVPGRMASNDVQIIVPGMKETAKAWEVTTTEIKPLITDRTAVAGGTLLH